MIYMGWDRRFHAPAWVASNVFHDLRVEFLMDVETPFICLGYFMSYLLSNLLTKLFAHSNHTRVKLLRHHCLSTGFHYNRLNTDISHFHLGSSENAVCLQLLI